MAVAVDPHPVALPLPGGRQQATVTVEPLLAAEVLAPPGLFDRRPGTVGRLRALAVPRRAWTWVPIPAFLIEHPGAGAILVDTGMHPSVAADPRQNLGALAGRLQRLRMDPEQALERQLVARGISAADIAVVIMTHLHYDHASGVSEFPDATFVVDEREWAAARSGGMLQGYRHRHIDHAFDWRTVDFNGPDVNSFASFGLTVDLFGDGSVRLLSTPGHSAGHMSVLVALAQRELLLAGDAIYSLEALRRDQLPLFVEDEHRYRRSVGEIRHFVEQTPGALVIAGHDPQAWPELAPRYE